MTSPPRRLDVLFLTHNFPRHSGDFAGRFLHRFAGLLRARGIIVGVVAPHASGIPEFEVMDDVPIWRFRYATDVAETLAYRGDWGGASIFGPHGLRAHYRFFRAFAQTARRVAADTSPRVVHAHWWIPAGWAARPLARHHRLIVTSHGTDIRLLQHKAWMRPLARQVYGAAAQTTTVSRWMADFLRTTYPELADRVGVAPMPPEDSIFHGTVRTATGAPPIILAVTRYTAQKRNDVLVAALEQLRQQGIDFRCRMIGDGGSERARIEHIIRERDLSSRVALVASLPQTELAEEYRRADVTVLPAVDEGFGLALLEAQLCGCAVIGAASGGITDIVSDGQTGLLARPDDPADLARCLKALLTDNDRRMRLAVAGQRSAQAAFSSTVIVDRFLSWYQLG